MNPESNFHIQYQNQLQFNLNVPVTTDKLAVQFQRPQPIFIERIAGLHALQGKNMLKPAEIPHIKKDTSFLLEDKMSAMSQLARRDIQRGHLPTQISSDGPVTKNMPTSSNQHTYIPQHKSSVRRQRPHHPVTIREAEKNRIFGAVQTPPPQKPKALNESVVHFDKNTSCLGTSQNEQSRLIAEMLNYFQILQNFLERAVSNDSSEFLTPVTKGKHKDGFLYQEETTSRAQLRAEEHKIRCIRTVYNLTQKVKQLQKDLLTCDLNNSVKKSLLTTQIMAIYRGAAKTLQMFMNQLPFQKLESGLPSHYHDLALLIRCLIGLHHLPDKENLTDQLKSLEIYINNIDNLNSKWCMKAKQRVTFADKKTTGQTWVSDTKVDKNIFLTKDKPTSSLVQKNPGNKGSKNQFYGQHTLFNKGKENIFVRINPGRTNKQKQRPATTSQPQGKVMTEKTAARIAKDINFEHGKSAVAIHKYETKGTSDLHLNTNAPFYVQNLSNEDMREIFQYKSHQGDHSYDSLCTAVDSQYQSKESINSDIKESMETDMIMNSKIDIFDEDDDLNIQSDAAAMCDLPTLENIKLRLMEMQREKLEIQQRWSSFKFIGSSQRSNSETDKIISRPTDIHVHWLPKANNKKDDISDDPFGRLVVKEPILFTKPATRPSPHHNNFSTSEQHIVSLLHGKTLLKLKQTSVEKILQNQQQFEKYLKSISHHPSGKFNPWQLIEELSDEILLDCLHDVASEIEEINHEIAQHMFTSEFLVDKSPSPEVTLQNEKFDLERDDDNHFVLSQEKFETSKSSKSQPNVQFEISQSSKSQPNVQVIEQPQSKIWTPDVSVLNLKGETTVMFLGGESVHHMDSVSISSVESKKAASIPFDKLEVEDDRSELIDDDAKSESLETKDRNDLVDENGMEGANNWHRDDESRDDSNSDDGRHKVENRDDSNSDDDGRHKDESRDDSNSDDDGRHKDEKIVMMMADIKLMVQRTVKVNLLIIKKIKMNQLWTIILMNILKTQKVVIKSSNLNNFNHITCN
ncbi:hypothetical protein Btru_032084 [Bulinus truncatus]|nr:hypothetical protein Btru_032084 [Bulinus truncatus]